MARSTSQTTALACALTLAVSLPSALFAQAAPPAPSSPVLAPQPTSADTPPPAPKRNRAISGDVANMLAQTMPKFTPPPPAPTAAELAQKKAAEEAAAEAAAADLRDNDKPKNSIVRLPNYVVQEKRPPIFTEREIHTKKGLRDVAMRRYISDADRALNRFTLPLFGGGGWSPGSGAGSAAEQRALAMYAEDERLRNMADLADNANMIMRSDATAGAAAKDAVQKTYMRSTQFGYGGMAPK
ncbi:MAG: hypothetical protein Q8N06_14505 [Hydrogenophaga sp.]|nr:hypothetical protein [Hydrogenophaga sp.]